MPVNPGPTPPTFPTGDPNWWNLWGLPSPGSLEWWFSGPGRRIPWGELLDGGAGGGGGFDGGGLPTPGASGLPTSGYGYKGPTMRILSDEQESLPTSTQSQTLQLPSSRMNPSNRMNRMQPWSRMPRTTLPRATNPSSGGGYF